MRRLLIAGTNSGCGKTTVTCAILAALHRRGVRIGAFKCGPDYLDPMLHAAILGRPAHNLDCFFSAPDTLRYLLHTYGEELAVIEGVMGFYDSNASPHILSELTETPAALVIDCKGMSGSIGAVMQGFLHYRKNRIAGVVFNRLPVRLIPQAKALCRQMQTAYLGCLPPDAPTLESRHLGLITGSSDLRDKLRKLGALAEQYLCLDKLAALPCGEIPAFRTPAVPHCIGSPRIAVARDAAFCFLYAENLELLRQLGCELVYFSPLEDAELPAAEGLWLPGGYPELYARTLSENRSMRASILSALQHGMPCLAECGGFLYLHRTLDTPDGETFPMVGFFPADGIRGTGLKRFGYVTLTASRDNLLCPAGGQLRAHEFHYWDSTSPGSSFTARKEDGRTWQCVHAGAALYAGFPHLYFYTDIRMAARFADACAAYGGQHGTDPSDPAAG